MAPESSLSLTSPLFLLNIDLGLVRTLAVGNSRVENQARVDHLQDASLDGDLDEIKVRREANPELFEVICCIKRPPNLFGGT